MYKKRLLVLMVVFVCISIMLTACAGDSKAPVDNEEPKETAEEPAESSEGQEQASSDDKFTVFILPKIIGIPIFDEFERGAMEAAKDFDVEVIYNGPTAPDAAEQVKMLEDYINRGVDCVAVSPNDPAAFTPVLQKAREKGILVIDWDTYADPSVVDLSFRQMDDNEFGQVIWDSLVEHMGDSGDYAIITGGLTAENLNTWIDAGLAHAEKNYPNLNLVTDRVPSDEKQQVAYQKALDLMRAYPSLKGIIGMSTPAPIGAAQAVQEKGLQDKIVVVGTGLPNDSKPYLMDGSLKASVLYDPAKFTYMTVYLAKMKLEGKEITDGLEVPKVGKIRVVDNGRTVIMGPPLKFTKENVDDYNF